MTFTTPGRVIGHVGDHAVVQIDGGLLPVPDRHRVLVSGDGALVVVGELNSAAACAAIDACAAFSVQQEGPLGLLSPASGDGSPVALLLSRPWPRLALVRVSTPPPELDEGVPNGSASPREPTPRIR